MQTMTLEETLVRMRASAAGRLAEDLAQYLRGDGPTDTNLSAAPLLFDWQLTPRSTLAVRGRLEGMTGHTTTSEIFMIDLERGYARTFNSLFRLGRQSGE